MSMLKLVTLTKSTTFENSVSTTVAIHDPFATLYSVDHSV